MTLRRIFISSILLSFLFSPWVSGDDTLQVSGAWVRAGPPGIAVLAGYLTLTNHGAKDLVIEKVTSPDFAAVEIHRTVVQNGMARMLHQDTLKVSAGATVELAPGGMHLMLMQAKRPLKVGEQVTLRLTTRDAEPIVVTAPVKDKL